MKILKRKIGIEAISVVSMALMDKSLKVSFLSNK